MQLDPVIQALFQQMPQLAQFPTWEKTPAQAREAFKWLCQLATQSQPDRQNRGHQSLTALRFNSARVYTPVASGAAALPAIIYFTGGGSCRR
jgi:acetyl esterase/lipase